MNQQQTESKGTKEKKSFIAFFKNNLQRLIIVLVSIVYITQGLFGIAKKDTTIWDILGSIGLSVAVGVIISSSLVSMGLKDGRNSELFQGSMKAYGNAKKEATPHFDKLSQWCDYRNKLDLESARRNIIQGASLSWKAYKLGYYDEEKNLEKLEEEQLKALKEAKYCKIERLTYSDLLSDFPKSKRKNGSRYGTTEVEYQVKSDFSDLIVKIFLGIVCGLYGLVPLITEDNKAAIIAGVLWNCLQIILWLSFGITKYVKAKSFMEDEYRQSHIIQKTEYLNEFVVTIQNNPDIIKSVDEELELDEYIQKYLENKNATSPASQNPNNSSITNSASLTEEELKKLQPKLLMTEKVEETDNNGENEQKTILD